MTKKRCRSHSAGFKLLKTAKTRQLQKRATFGVFLARTPPFFTQKFSFWNHVSEFSGGTHIREYSKTYPKSNFGWYGPPTCSIWTLLWFCVQTFWVGPIILLRLLGETIKFGLICNTPPITLTTYIVSLLLQISLQHIIYPLQLHTMLHSLEASERIPMMIQLASVTYSRLFLIQEPALPSHPHLVTSLFPYHLSLIFFLMKWKMVWSLKSK